MLFFFLRIILCDLRIFSLFPYRLGLSMDETAKVKAKCKR
jgi:hypothetical protein